MKLIIIFLFFATILLLFYSLFFLTKENQKHKVVNILFLRISVTVTLIALLTWSIYTGTIIPHGL